MQRMEYAASLDSIKAARVTIARHAAVTPVSRPAWGSHSTLLGLSEQTALTQRDVYA